MDKSNYNTKQKIYNLSISNGTRTYIGYINYNSSLNAAKDNAVCIITGWSCFLITLRNIYFLKNINNTPTWELSYGSNCIVSGSYSNKTLTLKKFDGSIINITGF